MLEIGSSDYLSSGHFSPRERAAVLWAEHVAKNTARERDDVSAEVKRHFTEQELVELTGVCGLFGQSNRFQDSMCLPIEEQSEVDKIRQSVRADPERIKVYLERMVENWPSIFPEAQTRGGARLEARSDHPGDTGGPARVPLLDPATAPEDSRRFMDAAKKLLGALPNAVRMWAHVPHVGKLFLPFFVAFERDGLGSVLPGALRLMVMLKTHHVHSAGYLRAHHTALARAAGVTEEQLAALASGATAAPCFSERERAAIAWAEKVALNAAKRDKAVYDALRKHFVDAEIVELTALVAICSNADLVYNALRVPVERAEVVQALNSSIRLDPQRLRTYIRTLLADWPREFPVPDAALAA
ncbi:MAG: carboxymuconolactone decarboxylase family protein [Burkholderiales bacterium]